MLNMMMMMMMMMVMMMMMMMSPEDKVWFEGTWYKDDLRQIGIEEERLNTSSCVEIPEMIEITPVGIRSAAGCEFPTEHITANVTPIPPGAVRLLSHKVVRFGKRALAPIQQHGLCEWSGNWVDMNEPYVHKSPCEGDLARDRRSKDAA